MTIPNLFYEIEGEYKDLKEYKQLVNLCSQSEQTLVINNGEKLIKLFPNDINYELLGSVYLDQKNSLKAYEFFEKAFEMNKSVNTFFNLTNILYYNLAKKEEAVNIGYINDFKESIIELIDWCNSNNELTKYLSHFMQRKNDLWVKFSMTDKIFSLFKDKEAIEMLEAIQESGITKEDLNKLIALFPNGIPKNVMDYAKEDARKKKEFSNLLEVGSKVEQLFIKTLEQFKISSERDKIIHAGGGSYDIRVFNPDTNKSFYIELKSCKYQNTEPINIAVSQAKRAVKELANENFAFVIIERSANNDMDEEYIKNNTKYFKNPI